MKAAILTEPGRIEITDIPTPEPGRGEVLVRVREAGICGSDFSKFTGQLGGPYGIVPGHEGVGVIAALGEQVEGFSPGDRVVIQPNIACGACELCLSGKENICHHKLRMGIDVNGVFAEYVTLPARYLWPLPNHLSFAEGVLVEPLAVALHGFNKAPSHVGENVLICGTGVIGLFFVQLAVMAGSCVHALDIAAPRLEVARRLGAAKTFSSLAQLEAEAPAFSVAYESSGKAEALANLIRICRPGARIILSGLPKAEYPISTSAIVRKELFIGGAMIYTNEFARALELLQSGLIEHKLFITSVNPLEKIEAVLRDFPSPHRVKDLILID